MKGKNTAILATIILLSSAVAGFLYLKDRPAPATEEIAAPGPDEAARTRPLPPPPPPPVKPPVDLQTLSESAQNPPPLTPEQIEDDEQDEKAQVDAALAQLSSNDPAERIEGADQLGAYPTKEAEAALTQAVTSDPEADVRNAAAQSLGYVEKPSEATIIALLGVLEDPDEDVRLSALSTLEDFLASSEEGSKRYKKVLAGLKAKATARSVPEETREAIGEVLQDQAGGSP